MTPSHLAVNAIPVAASLKANTVMLPLSAWIPKQRLALTTFGGFNVLANLPPYEGKCKVFIIEDAECLSNEAANSLLKILEEPPSNVIWLLLAAEEGRLLPTIVSRCQRLELKPMPSNQMQKALIARHHVDPAKAKLLARLSHGCLGWALSALADDGILNQRAQRIARLSSLLTAGVEQRFAYAQQLATQFSQNRKVAAEVMEAWFSWWRDLLLIKGGCKDAITNIDYEATLGKQAQVLNLSQVKKFLANLCLTREEISRNVNSRLAFESLLLNMPKKEIIDG
jgi:DNA polymerase III, gamma/tau subunits